MNTLLRGGVSHGQSARRTLAYLTLVVLSLLLLVSTAAAHAVAEGDKGYIQEITGVHLIPFVYLGVKHMVTGYDHLLFLFGVIFFLYRLKHIGIYVSARSQRQVPPAIGEWLRRARTPAPATGKRRLSRETRG